MKNRTSNAGGTTAGGTTAGDGGVPSGGVPSGGDREFAVRAAGALCWRIQKQLLEVLLIHRPRYDDWSWPKGKLDDGETMPECAVREVCEEVGLHIRLGIPLPRAVYQVNSGLKEVQYWASHVPDANPAPDGNEVDSFLWCSPQRAKELLTNPTDILPLEALVSAHDQAELETWPLLVVRHAKAKPRSAWTLAEGDRPLAATGVRQALALSRLLMAWRPDRVATSPWLRCVATMSPYVQATNTKVKVYASLTEAKHSRQPDKTAAVVERLFDKARPVALCTHRPALPTVLAKLAGHMPAGLAAALPTSDPFLAPGEVIICQVSGREQPRVVSVERYKPFED
ncbi:NUDIX hydrolase [Arthrobacter sp. H14-L1]|uniref:NUDIX hydrolase n=1 Tax=Arthrobacter sp. H14-L1 TaxID=2996697 RepID=UPI00226E0BEA|nr:NUDIX hydrolase [Arthrobacter sp. H14-L1]MCY0904506.1 NUDIX hydrolase [Arthrobacter sp. H14-L1]